MIYYYLYKVDDYNKKEKSLKCVLHGIYGKKWNFRLPFCFFIKFKTDVKSGDTLLTILKSFLFKIGNVNPFWFHNICREILPDSLYWFTYLKIPQIHGDQIKFDTWYSYLSETYFTQNTNWFEYSLLGRNTSGSHETKQWQEMIAKPRQPAVVWHR